MILFLLLFFVLLLMGGVFFEAVYTIVDTRHIAEWPSSVMRLPTSPPCLPPLCRLGLWLIGDSSLRWDCKSHRAVINFAR